MQAALKPTPQRRQHDRVSRSATIADTEGRPANPWIAENLLGRLERAGDITRQQRLAGEQFATLFERAHLDTLRAADLTREHHAAGPDLMPRGPDRAREAVHQALVALGGHQSPAGSCAWFVLGVQLSMRVWATRQGWAGRPIRQEVAKGTLLATLGVLAQHFGIER